MGVDDLFSSVFSPPKLNNIRSLRSSASASVEVTVSSHQTWVSHSMEPRQKPKNTRELLTQRMRSSTKWTRSQLKSRSSALLPTSTRESLSRRATSSKTSDPHSKGVVWSDLSVRLLQTNDEQKYWCADEEILYSTDDKISDDKQSTTELSRVELSWAI